MNKEKIKKTLAGIGVAGLITSVSILTGCQNANTPAEDASSGGADTTAAVKASCGAGSCGAAMDSTATPADSTKAGSCGQGAETPTE